MQLNPKIDEILKVEWPFVKRQLSPPSSEPFDPSQRIPADFIAWENRLTPGFPSEWPCPAYGELIYYAWAAGRQLGLVDGERTTAPWARFSIRLPNGDVQYQRLEQGPRMGSTQGVRPLSPAESALFKKAKILFDEFPAVLAGQGNLGDEGWLAQVKLSYQLWIKCNILANQIRPMHEEFFAWLDV